MPNPSLIHADIFFFISTIALVAIAACIVVALVLSIGILRNVRDITERARAEWQEIVTDSGKLRASLRDEGLKWKHVVGLVRTFFTRESVKQARTARTARAAQAKTNKAAGSEE